MAAGVVVTSLDRMLHTTVEDGAEMSSHALLSLCVLLPALSRCHCQCSERLLADGPSLPAAVAAAAAAVAFVRSTTQQTTRVSTHLGYTDVPCQLNTLTPTVAMGTAIKHPVPDRVKPSFVIFDIRTLALSHERQSARMSKITNDGLTRSGTGCSIAVPMWQQWASRG